MKRKILLPLIAFVIAFVAAQSSPHFAPSTYGRNPYIGDLCSHAHIAPYEPRSGPGSCGSGSTFICKVRFVDPENSSMFVDVDGYNFFKCSMLAIARDY